MPKPQTSDLGVNTEKYRDSGAIHLNKMIIQKIKMDRAIQLE
jgi:hypothetical protein